MSWILVLCLLGAGGMFPETWSMNDILEINKNLILKDDPTSSFLSEGDIVRSVTSKFSPKLFLWPLVNKTVVIPYDLSLSYDEHQQNVIFEAFKDLEASTCIRFVERTTQRDYISILPGSGCYSSVGRVGKRQVVSLAFQCVERGKGVILHELMHVIGFWHEHSRADRDVYVTIHWNAIRKENWSNFCKYETTNMVVKYDLESILHYSSIAFAKSGDITIEPRDSRAHMGQRIKLSDSDILRVNKLYHCPQYIPSEDDDEDIMVLDNPAPGVATCSEANMNDPENLSTAVFTELLTTASFSSKERGSISPLTEESKTSPVALYSSSLNSKTGSAPTLFSSQESKLESTGFIYSTQEPTHSIMGLSMPKGDIALESTTIAAAPESMQVNSTVLYPQETTEQPSAAPEDNSTVLVLRRATWQPPRRTAAPESVLEDDSTVLIPHRAMEQFPMEPTRGTAASESVNKENSTFLFLQRTTDEPSADPKSIQNNSTVLIPQGITKHSIESGGTAAPESIHKGNSTVLILHRATKQPSTTTATPESLQEDISTVLIPHVATAQPSRGTAAPGTVHKDNSPILILQEATKQPIQSTVETAVTEPMQDNATDLILRGTTKIDTVKSTRETMTSESMQVSTTILVSHRAAEQPSRGTGAPESIQHNSMVLPFQAATKHPVEPTRGTAALKSVHEDNSTVSFLHRVIEEPSTTAALEFVKKNNSAVFIPHRATEQPPTMSPGRTAALESAYKDNSTVLILREANKPHLVESTRGTSAPETLHEDNSTVLILQEANKHHPVVSTRGTSAPETLHEDNSTVVILREANKPHPVESTRGTSAPETLHEDNSTVVILREANKPHPVESTRGTSAPETLHEDNSTVLILQEANKHHPVVSTRGTSAPETLHEDNSTVVILREANKPHPVESTRGTSAPETLHEDNSTVVILREANKPHPVESTRGTSAPETLYEDNSTVLILQEANKHHPVVSTRGTSAPETLHEDNSTVVILREANKPHPVESTRGTSAPETLHEDNSTVLILQEANKHHPVVSTRGTSAPETLHEDNSTVVILRETNKPHPVESTRGTSAPETLHEDNSTVLILQEANKHHPVVSTRETSAPETMHEDNSTVLKPHLITEQLPLASTKGTAAPESIEDHSTLLIPYRATKQHQITPAIGSRGAPESLQEDNSTVLIPRGDPKHPVDSTRGTSAPEAVHEDNATVFISHGATKHPVEYTGGTAALESVYKENYTELILHRDIVHHPIETHRVTVAPDYIQDHSIVFNTQNAISQQSDPSKAFTTVISSVASSVTSSKSNMDTGDFRGVPVEINATTFQRLNFNGEEHSVMQAIFENQSSDSSTVSTVRESSLTKAILPTFIFMPKRTRAIIDAMEENQISARSQASEMQQAIAEDTRSSSGSGEGLNVSQDRDEHVKKNLQFRVRKRSLAGRTFDSWSWQLPRWLHSNKLAYLHNDRRKSRAERIEPFCGFEHGFCGWKQSTEDDLDWKLSWGSLNFNTGHFTPEGFHLSLKNSPEVSVTEQRALLLRSIVQPSNCISFWYSLRHGIMATLNVYITSSGGEQRLLWTSGGQDCVKWTKAQIMLPPHLLSNNTYVVVEGVMGLSDRSNIAIDDLYVGQCS